MLPSLMCHSDACNILFQVRNFCTFSYKISLPLHSHGLHAAGVDVWNIIITIACRECAEVEPKTFQFPRDAFGVTIESGEEGVHPSLLALRTTLHHFLNSLLRPGRPLDDCPATGPGAGDGFRGHVGHSILARALEPPIPSTK